MNATRPRQYFAATQRAVAYADTIEWEDMPSLTKRLVNRDPMTLPRGANHSRFQGATGFDSTWGETMPIELDAAPVASSPFVERLQGLATREVNEPDVFLHFFGPNSDH